MIVMIFEMNVMMSQCNNVIVPQKQGCLPGASAPVTTGLLLANASGLVSASVSGKVRGSTCLLLE